MHEQCPACGAPCPDGRTCEDDFHQMLFWEWENPVNGEVHHLAVLSYHMQHPHLYSPEGLENAMGLLHRFVGLKHSPAQIRESSRDQVDSGKRQWKVTARPDAKGSYTTPVTWTMTGADVIAAGEPRYRESVRAWAESIYASLKAAGYLQM